jgi:hypothetical protein
MSTRWTFLGDLKTKNKKLNRRDRGARRGIKKGIMEEWNIGMLGKKKNRQNPLFHHSIIPTFQFVRSAVDFFDLGERRDFYKKNKRPSAPTRGPERRGERG